MSQVTITHAALVCTAVRSPSLAHQEVGQPTDWAEPYKVDK